MGKPHMRFVSVSENEDFIYWGEQKALFGNTRSKFIRREDIVDIKVGYNASAVLKRHKLPIEFDDLIFSIQTKTRTLDL
jgi:hypothetical protein